MDEVTRRIWGDRKKKDVLVFRWLWKEVLVMRAGCLE